MVGYIEIKYFVVNVLISIQLYAAIRWGFSIDLPEKINDNWLDYAMYSIC